MQPWFVWKGQDSRDFGLWVTEKPAPTKAAERTEDIVIPGRAGNLTYREGENVHEAYVKECTVQVKAGADFASILNWLSGHGEVIFSSEPDRVYDAHLFGEVKFVRISHMLKQATIPFAVNPHKGQYPPETATAFTADGTIYNPGTVTARPLVEITFTSTCTLSLGGYEMTFTAPTLLPPPEVTITVDCDAEIITDSEGIWRGVSSGDFFRLAPGANEVDLTDCEISILPRWRWY